MWCGCEADASDIFVQHKSASTLVSLSCEDFQPCEHELPILRKGIMILEDEYCPNRDNDGDKCSPPEKFRDDKKADESVATHVSYDDETSEHEKMISKASLRLKTVLKRKSIPELH